MSLLQLETPFDYWLFDGAIGTQLQAVDVLKAGEFGEGLNLKAPQLIGDMHRAYLEAGATLLTTNTFSANRVRLQERGLGDQTVALNVAGARLSKEVAGKRAWVAGSIGPLGAKCIEPYGTKTVSYAEAVATFAEQARALTEGGVDILIIETMFYPLELQAAVEGAQSASDKPIIASMTYIKEWGIDPADVARQAGGWGVAAIGANCNSGPADYLEIVSAYRENTALPIVVEPNAGLPRVDLKTKQTTWDIELDDFVAGMAKLRQAGAHIIGSCCGSTPAFTRALKPWVLTQSAAVR